MILCWIRFAQSILFDPFSMDALSRRSCLERLLVRQETLQSDCSPCSPCSPTVSFACRLGISWHAEDKASRIWSFPPQTRFWPGGFQCQVDQLEPYSAYSSTPVQLQFMKRSRKKSSKRLTPEFTPGIVTFKTWYPFIRTLELIFCGWWLARKT